MLPRPFPDLLLLTTPQEALEAFAATPSSTAVADVRPTYLLAVFSYNGHFIKQLAGDPALQATAHNLTES